MAATRQAEQGGATIAELAEQLRDGRVTAEALAGTCIERIADPAGEGARCFVTSDAAKTLDQARAHDMMRSHGVAPSPLAGIPVSIKDLFDVAGEVTRAASKIFADAPPAMQDAPSIARLRAAGAVFTGRTTMTEFAYSGVGLNPHYGTPANPWDRQTGRIPGGSTSGGAVSVTDGMAALAIGTDTGGSCRIPAALCGLVGYKPTASRISRKGVFPLARSLDSIGSLGRSVACVALADAIMAGEDYRPPQSGPASRLRLIVPTTTVLDDMDETVSGAFEAALCRLRTAGAIIEEMPISEIAEIPELTRNGGLAGVEARASHLALLPDHADKYDPRVLKRLEIGTTVSGAEYVAILEKREELIARFSRRMTGYDALILPTVPIVAPPFSAFEEDERYWELNWRLLRNPSCFNMLDGCAISLPCHEPGGAPVGLMLATSHGGDHALLTVAATVEAVLTG